MEYITSIVPETVAALGPEEGGHLAGAAARLIGMHTFDEVASLLGGVEPGPAGFAKASRGWRPARAMMPSFVRKERWPQSDKRLGG
jgi:hypothetical protein